MDDELRSRRVADNEGLFREVNERVEDVAQEMGVDPEILCECARRDCTRRLRVPVQEYERVRAYGRRFLVLPGHEQLEFERVIDQADGWLVVEKLGAAGRAAAEDDPRA